MTALVNGPYYNFAKDLIYLVIATLGVIVAWRGLSTWRTQLKGNVEYEAARRLYRAVLKLRDAMSHVRNPAIWPAEMAEAETKYPEARKDTTNAVYYSRWEKMKEALIELQSEQLEAEVLWGNDVIKKLKPLRTCVTKLNVHLSDFLRPSEQRIRPRKNVDEIVYELRSENETDVFSNEIDAAVDEIGNFLKPKYGFQKIDCKS